MLCTRMSVSDSVTLQSAEFKLPRLRDYWQWKHFGLTWTLWCKLVSYTRTHHSCAVTCSPVTHAPPHSSDGVNTSAPDVAIVNVVPSPVGGFYLYMWSLWCCSAAVSGPGLPSSNHCRQASEATIHPSCCRKLQSPKCCFKIMGRDSHSHPNSHNCCTALVIVHRVPEKNKPL